MIKDYIRYRRPILFFYLVVLIFFPMIHFLYHFPMESIGYSMIIFTFFYVLWVMLDGYYFKQKLSVLQTVQKNMSQNRHMLPEPTNRIEHQYQQMMFVLYDLLQKNESELEKIHLEQVEYYTLWVHQIKTPISAMRLSLQHTTEDQEAVLEQELFKIEQYVELALQYTKIKNLSTDLVIDQYPLEEIIHQTVKKYASLFIYKKLSVNIHDFHTDVMTDSKWLSFILEQIISNAIKYTNRGGIEIWYTDHVLQIKDTGIGILKEDMDRLFEKGYTGYNGRIDKRASGIGLYLVKRVSDSLALKVEINSEVGQGTVVKIVFPEESNAFYYE